MTPVNSRPNTKHKCIIIIRGKSELSCMYAQNTNGIMLHVLPSVAGKVASFKELQGGVEFRTEIPKNLSGKILRRHLKEEYLSSQNQ